jgi:putative membrane protein
MSWLAVILHWIIAGVALAITSAIVPGFNVKRFRSAVFAALLIGLVSYFVRPLLLFLAFPFTILTLGLFIFVVDAIILRVCAAMMAEFEITNWFSALVGAVILAVTSSILHAVFI